MPSVWRQDAGQDRTPNFGPYGISDDVEDRRGLPPAGAHEHRDGAFPQRRTVCAVSRIGGCTMAAVGIAEAARLAGVAPSTLHRAMTAGRLAYTKDSAGLRKIDVAELGRVFAIKRGKDDPLTAGNGAQLRNGARTERRKTTHSAEIDALRALLDERERTIARLDAALADLHVRLDAETAERRAVQERLTALLTHRQTGSVPAVAPLTGPRRPWWRRWLR